MLENKLEDLKPGAEVVVKNAWGGIKIEKVQKVTPKQIVLKYEIRYRKNNGSCIGDSTSWISIPTKKDYETVKKQEMASEITRRCIIDFLIKLSVDELDAILETFRKYESEVSQ